MDTAIDFLVIGAQKCATTWLHECLAEHPQLNLPPKREREYLGGPLHKANGDQWYFDLLGPRQSGQLRGDVSVDYLLNPESPALVSALSPDTKIIVSIREPVSRAVSACLWGARFGMMGDDLDPNNGLHRALAAQSDGETEANRPFFELLERGRYGKYLNQWIDAFPAEQTLVLMFEQIQSNRAAALASVYRFLGVDDQFVPGKLTTQPKRNSYRPWMVNLQRFLVDRIGLPVWRVNRLMNILNRTVARVGSGGEQRDIDPAVAQQARELLAADLPILKNVLERIPPGQRPDFSDVQAAWAVAP